MSNVFNGVAARCVRAAKWLSAGALAMTIAGCASQSHYGGTNVGTMPGAAALGPDISNFLDNATAGTISAFPKSPWGSNVSIIVQERYFAASGRLCTHLDVARQNTPAAADRAQVACLVDGEGWYAQRLVTQVLGNPSTS